MVQKKQIKNASIVVLILVLSLLSSSCRAVSSLWSKAILQAEYNELLARMNNQYVDSDYLGWKEITVFDEFCFNIPSEWYTEQRDARTIALIDDSGVFGYIALISEDAFLDILELYKTVESDIKHGNFRDADMKGMYGNGCYLYESLIWHQDNTFCGHFEIQAVEANRNCTMLFMSDTEDAAFREIVEAIAYSYKHIQ